MKTRTIAPFTRPAGLLLVTRFRACVAVASLTDVALTA